MLAFVDALLHDMTLASTETVKDKDFKRVVVVVVIIKAVMIIVGIYCLCGHRHQKY